MMRNMAAWIFVLVVTGSVRGSPPPQWRAFWVDAFNPGIKTPEQAAQLIADLKSINGNALIVQVRKRGDALFRKSVEPFADDSSIPADFDPLDHLLRAAHKENIQVHAWVNVGTIWPGRGGLPKSPEHVFNKHGPGKPGRAAWLTRDDAGRERLGDGYFVDPGHPDYQEHYVNVVRGIVKNYPVDGIHFDFVRYPETEGDLNRGFGAGYNPTNVARFNQVHNRVGLPDRADPLWQAWRRLQVTQLVRRVRVALLEDRPEVLLSGAMIPWGGGPADEAGWYRTLPYNRVFQDWHNWRTEGLLDLIVPMNYDREANPAQKDYFDQWIAFEKRHRERALSVVGVGSYLNSISDTIHQVRRSLAPEVDAAIRGADGVCFYSYASQCKDRDGDGKRDLDTIREFLTVGPDAPFAKPTVPPVVPRLRQPTEGVIAGRATGPDGQPQDTVIIRAVPLAGGPALECSTDGNGHFALFGLAPGKYRLAVPTRGAAIPRVVEVHAGQFIRIAE